MTVLVAIFPARRVRVGDIALVARVKNVMRANIAKRGRPIRAENVRTMLFPLKIVHLVKFVRAGQRQAVRHVCSVLLGSIETSRVNVQSVPRDGGKTLTGVLHVLSARPGQPCIRVSSCRQGVPKCVQAANRLMRTGNARPVKVNRKLSTGCVWTVA